MRMSSNGRRVLRKGCSEGRSTIRPCLQWIKSPEAQANTTVFIAKFYGRVGLIDLCPLYSDRFCTGLWADVEPDLWLIHDAVQTAN